MAYVEKTLTAWLGDNLDYNKFPGTVAGKPLIYQAADGDPSLDADDWKVWDYIGEFPDLTQTPATADITTTGKVARSLIEIVPDAPAPSDLEINLGVDTDGTIDAIEGLVKVYQDALAADKKLYFGHFMGDGKKSQIYQGAVSWNSGLNGAFPDPVTTTISITPDLGAYNKYQVIAADISG